MCAGYRQVYARQFDLAVLDLFTRVCALYTWCQYADQGPVYCDALFAVVLCGGLLYCGLLYCVVDCVYVLVVALHWRCRWYLHSCWQCNCSWMVGQVMHQSLPGMCVHILGVLPLFVGYCLFAVVVYGSFDNNFT